MGFISRKKQPSLSYIHLMKFAFFQFSVLTSLVFTSILSAEDEKVVGVTDELPTPQRRIHYLRDLDSSLPKGSHYKPTEVSFGGPEHKAGKTSLKWAYKGGSSLGIQLPIPVRAWKGDDAQDLQVGFWIFNNIFKNHKQFRFLIAIILHYYQFYIVCR